MQLGGKKIGGRASLGGRAKPRGSVLAARKLVNRSKVQQANKRVSAGGRVFKRSAGTFPKKVGGAGFKTGGFRAGGAARGNANIHNGALDAKTVKKIVNVSASYCLFVVCLEIMWRGFD